MRTYHSVKYQALLLVVIIIGSVYAGRLFSFFQNNNATIVTQPPSSFARMLAGSAPTTSPRQNIDRQQGDGTPSAQFVEPKVSTDSIAGSPSLPSNSATACAAVGAGLYRAQDMATGRILFARDQGERWPIASISKLITAIVASNLLKQDSIIPITANVETLVGNDHTLNVGEAYTVRDLVGIMLTVSSNDAAYALADAYGLSGFVAQMNDVAKTVGMDQTAFYEPSGLSYLNQSTLENIAKLLQYIYRSYPSIFAITRQQKFIALDQTSGKRKTFSNIDFYAGQSIFIGGKTGYIDQSGENLVGIFNYSGGKVIAGVFDSADRFKDMDALLRCTNAVVAIP
ncbi:MAG: serine hydrolase [Candidatus Paceibacterota bacterium]|jgi:D-alanyl-D-alanine carboxypeptidase